MRAYLDREFIEDKLARLTRVKYNRYYWWRRYELPPLLDKKTPLYEKLAHGDYDASDYLYQMEHELYLMEDMLSGIKNPDEKHEVRSLCMERVRRLNEDYHKHEQELINKLTSDFRRTFNIQKNELLEIMNDFDGTLLDLYQYIKNKRL